MIPTVEFSRILPDSAAEARILFRDVFTQSESEEEGSYIMQVNAAKRDETKRARLARYREKILRRKGPHE